MEVQGIVHSKGIKHSTCLPILAITNQCHSGGDTLVAPLIQLPYIHCPLGFLKESEIWPLDTGKATAVFQGS